MNVRRGQKSPELSATGRQGDAAIDIDLGHTVLVVRRASTGTPRAFGEDNELPSFANHLLACTAPHLHQRGRPPAPRSTAIMPALIRYQPKNGIYLSSRLRM